MTILDITRRGTKSEGQKDRGGMFGQAPSWMAWRGIVVPFGQVLICHSRGRNASVSPHPPMKGAKGDTRPRRDWGGLDSSPVAGWFHLRRYERLRQLL